MFMGFSVVQLLVSHPHSSNKLTGSLRSLLPQELPAVSLRLEVNFATTACLENAVNAWFDEVSLFICCTYLQLAIYSFSFACSIIKVLLTAASTATHRTQLRQMVS